jgi:biopolymer transport protein ExbD
MVYKKFDSINVVPFIDIILVLLVIVLTTASFTVKGLIPVNLSKNNSITKYKPTKKDLIITIKSDGKLFFNKERIIKKDIKFKLEAYKNDIIISINCDRKSQFKNFVYILDILKRQNFKNIGIITKNE